MGSEIAQGKIGRGTPAARKRRYGVAARHAVGAGVGGGLPAGYGSRRGGQGGCGGGSGRAETDDPAVNRLDQIYGGHNHCQWDAESRADQRALRAAAGQADGVTL